MKLSILTDWVKHTYIITTTTATTTRFCHDIASKNYLSLLLLDISLSEASIVTVLLLLCLFNCHQVALLLDEGVDENSI